MNREIKFRAWDIEAEQMVFPEDDNGYGYPIDFVVSKDGMRLCSYLDSGLFTNDEEHGGVVSHEATVMQYTGLKDKNGVEIYEGDIVDTTEFDTFGGDTPFKGLVKFHDGEWQLWRDDDQPSENASDGGRSLFYIHNQDDEAEVIGNIYENPELLEVKDTL